MDKIILEEIKRFKEILKESETSNILMSPLDGPLVVTSPFGEKRSYEVHPGVDLRARERENVMSPLDGVVKVADMNYNDKCGGTIIIEHPNGFRSGFCHMSRIDVKAGDKVTQKQIVGLSGGDRNDPGKGNSKDRHLHWTLKKDGKLVNPMDYVDKSIGPLSYNIASQENPEDTEEQKLLDKILNSEYGGKKIKDLIGAEKKEVSMLDFFKNFYELLVKII